MKVHFRPETNFFCSNASTLWPHIYFVEGLFQFREILHPTCANFKTTSSSIIIFTLLTTAATIKAYFKPSPHPTPLPRPVVIQTGKVSVAL